MAKSIIISVDELINKLEAYKNRGNTKVTLYGYIADEKNDSNIIESDKEAFTEPSYAEWSLRDRY